MGDRIPAVNEEVLVTTLDDGVSKVYNRHISNGRFLKLRQRILWPLMAAFFLIPWFNIDGRPAMYFNLDAAQFHIFWATFYPQDGFMLACLLIIAAFTLFAVTNVFGRVWCGFTCPQTVWTHIFMWWEFKTEGDRAKRIRLDKMPWNKEKISKKTLKVAGWFLLAFWTGLTFVGYFSPIRELLPDLFMFNANAGPTFWVLFFTAATYGNAGYLREAVCKYMCPYARFQAAMYDSNTYVVSYDGTRGEQRGPRKKKDDHKAKGMGDCIDCSWCVQVCPVDIDIRDGLQYECINCGLCVDACDSVMDKMGYARGLIRFTTENELQGKKTSLFRPRSIAYAVFIVAVTTALITILSTRVPLEVGMKRDRNIMFRETAEGMIENPYRLHILNMDDKQHSYTIKVIKPAALKLSEPFDITIKAGESYDGVIRLEMPPSSANLPSYKIELEVNSVDNKISKTVESRFMAPGLR